MSDSLEENTEEQTEDVISELDPNKEEDELPPPEDQNDARELNVGNILMIAVVGVLVLFLIVFIAMNLGGKKKNEQDSSELDKAGTKTYIDFFGKGSVEQSSTNKEEEIPETSIETDSSENEDKEEPPDPLTLFGNQGDVGTAPVASVGSTSGTYKSDRPDTRNSKSPRKIEGLAALDYSNQVSNSSLVSQIMSGNYGTNAYGQKMTKEEFIAQQMAQTQSIQNQLYGNTNYGNGNGSSNTTGLDKQDFFNSGNGSGGSGTYLSKAALWDGTIISGALVTAINTDNPGVVIARVTENVYSSQDQSYLLIPEGSLLMATYNSSVSYGQNKVQVAWNLLIRPDNYRIQLGNMNGVMPNGASGYKGSVSNHPWETLKALGLVALYSVIQTEVTNDINSQNNEYLKNSMTDVYAEASKLGNKIVDKALDIKPTIKIKEGTEIKLITNTPLELPPVEMNHPNQKYVRMR